MPGEDAESDPAVRPAPEPSRQPDSEQSSEAKPLRLFVALDLPPQWRDALRDQSHALEQAVPGFARWVAPELIHLTLVFLGSQRPSTLSNIQAAVDQTAASGRPILLSPGDLGSFGGPRSVRVIWAGISEQPQGALEALYARLTGSLVRAGVSFEQSSFRPHLTLGRAKRDRSEGSEAMYRAIRTGAAGAFKRLPDHQCEELVLIRSDLRPTGPIYTPLHRAAFGSS